MFARRPFIFASALVLLAAAGVIYETRVVARQREQLRALQIRRGNLTRELEQVRVRNETDAAALAALQREIVRAHPASPDPAINISAAETRAWLATFATVKRLFAEHPEAGIPELQLLELRSWLGTIKNLSLDSEEQVRQSLATIRTAAKNEFMQRLAFALQKYLKARDGELPPDLLALATYFTPAIDPAMLDRYKLTRSGNMARSTGGIRDPVVLEKAPIDEDFDTRSGVNVGPMADGSGWGVVRGSFGGIGPAAWIDDYQDRLKRAQSDFTREHPGTKPGGLADVVSYMNPPLDAAVAEKIIKAEKARAK